MWSYKDKQIQSIEDVPSGAFGFIYLITHTPTGKFYIGKKQLFSERNIKLGKKELKEQLELKKPGRKPTKKLVKKESDWLQYWGSNSDLLLDIEICGKDKFKKEILIFTFNKKQNTYYEIKYQFIYDVLESQNCYNSNINSTFFRKDLLVLP
jgi:hypothetical protein